MERVLVAAGGYFVLLLCRMLFSCAHLSICLHTWRSTELRGVALACQCKNQEPLSASALAAASGTHVPGNQTEECKRIERGLVAAKGGVVRRPAQVRSVKNIATLRSPTDTRRQHHGPVGLS